MQNSADSIIQKIENHKSAGNYDAALTETLEWLKKYVDDYRFYEELADIYLYQENLEKAEEVIHYARELHPESGTGIYLQGYIFLEKWDYEQALETLEHAKILFPNNAEIIRSIGWCNVMIGNMQKGIALLRRAHGLAPDDESIHQYLTTALLLYEEQNSTQLTK